MSLKYEPSSQVSGEERRASSGLLRRTSSTASGGSRRGAFGDEEAGSGIAGGWEDPELRAEVRIPLSSFYLLLSSQELSDTTIYEP